jgi:hypothetical protein
MPIRSVFQWPDGRGWIILSGGHDPGSEIRAFAIGRAAADGAVAIMVMGSGGESAERILDDVEDLGAPSGYLVDAASEDDATVTAKLADAGMILIEEGESAAETKSALLGAAVEGIRAAYQNGAVVLAEGMSAQALGGWIVRDDGQLTAGLGWLAGGLIAPSVTSAAQWGHDLLLEHPLAYVVGIGAGSALALGPDGQVETWGKGEVSVALGRNLRLEEE